MIENNEAYLLSHKKNGYSTEIYKTRDKKRGFVV